MRSTKVLEHLNYLNLCKNFQSGDLSVMRFLKSSIVMSLSLNIAISTLAPQSFLQQASAKAKPATPITSKGSKLNNVDPRQKPSEAIEAPPAQPPLEAFRKKAPVAPAPRPFQLPPVDKYELDNGLKVELVEDHRFPFVTVELGMKSGSTLESRDKLGLADMTADMITEGTKTRNSKQIADEIDYIGGGLRAGSDYDFSLEVASALSKYTDRLFDVFTDVLFNPTFPEDELKLKKDNLIQSLAMKRSEPGFLADERFHKVLFGNHPYGVVAPTPATVRAITRDDLQKFHDNNYVPNSATLIVVGDFDKAKMKDLIASKFGNWKRGIIAVPETVSRPVQHGRHIYLVNRPGSVQTTIRIGNVSIDRKDPNYFPMLVANQILGGAAQARLFLNIREQKGYTYGAYSGLVARKQPGMFTAQSDVRTEVTAPSIEEFMYELDRLRNVKSTDKELKDAENYLTGSFQLSLETQSGLAQKLLDTSLFDLPADYLQTYSEKIAAINADDVRKVSRKLIDYDNLVVTVVGDAAKIEPDLEFFAPVDVYDTTGKLSTDWEKQPSPGG